MLGTEIEASRAANPGPGSYKVEPEWFKENKFELMK